jgi:hypothetical protein
MVDNPTDGEKINCETATVEGNVEWEKRFF